MPDRDPTTKIIKNLFFGSIHKSSIQMVSLSVKNMGSKYSRLGTFNIIQGAEQVHVPVLGSAGAGGNLAGMQSEIHRDDCFREYKKSRVSNFFLSRPFTNQRTLL
jgi:hypothetical protein